MKCNSGCFEKELGSNFRGNIRRKELLSRHTSFKIGGPAFLFAEPRDTSDLKLLLKLAKRYNINILVIGMGSNILAADKGVANLVIKLNARCFKQLRRTGKIIEAGSGSLLSQIINFAQKNGLSGLEFLSGIPGTAGGALVMNAGITESATGRRTQNKSISQIVEKITVMDYNGRIKDINNKQAGFGYRQTGLGRYIILSVSLNLEKAAAEEIKRKIRKYVGCRKTGIDYSFPSAGCIFKNPVGYSAGRLIDLCGLKGKKVNSACISLRHGNFILNTGGAKAKDVISLMGLIKKTVKNKFNLTLQPEIKIWN